MLLVLGGGYYASMDKVIIIADKPKLQASSPQMYLLSLYARYQLEPDTSELIYSLRLLAASDDLSLAQQQSLQKILEYLQTIPPYSEAKVLSKLHAIVLNNKPKKQLSFMGLDLSSIITTKDQSYDRAISVIEQIHWAIHMHDEALYHRELQKLSKTQLVADKKLIDDLSQENIKLPKLPWAQWLKSLSNKG